MSKQKSVLAKQREVFAKLDLTYGPQFKDGKKLEFFFKSLKMSRNQKQSWGRKVKDAFNTRCAISGTTTQLETHHLFGEEAFPIVNCMPENGIFITSPLHLAFHRRFGRGDSEA